MFTTISVYFLMTFLIFWSYCGYILLMAMLYILRSGEKNNNVQVSELPKIALMVPCYNEEGYVTAKVENLKQLVYDKDKLIIYFLHGLSTDNTANEIKSAIEGMSNCHLIDTLSVGKINQLNYGLQNVIRDVDIIANTDMDTILEPDALMKIADEFSLDPRVAVVGANISPSGAISMEEAHWNDQNSMRMMESRVYSSSIVVAPCYAFRAGLLSRFPEDCIADDIFIAFKANTDGYIVKYIVNPTGVETRCPRNFEEFIRHKFRKGNAYIREILRSLYLLPYMSGWWKVIYLTKLTQLVLMPWILPYYALSSTSLLLSGKGLMSIALYNIMFLLTTFILTFYVMKIIRSRFFGNNIRVRKRSTIMLFIISNMLLLLIGISYPFYRQSSSYSKIAVTTI